MAYTPRTRKCWMYNHGCRKNAPTSTRIGHHVYIHCEDHSPWPVCKADEKEAKP